MASQKLCIDCHYKWSAPQYQENHPKGISVRVHPNVKNARSWKTYKESNKQRKNDPHKSPTWTNDNSFSITWWCPQHLSTYWIWVMMTYSSLTQMFLKSRPTLSQNVLLLCRHLPTAYHNVYELQLVSTNK